MTFKHTHTNTLCGCEFFLATLLRLKILANCRHVKYFGIAGGALHEIPTRTTTLIWCCSKLLLVYNKAVTAVYHFFLIIPACVFRILQDAPNVMRESHNSHLLILPQV